jgi:hypothetical protein
MLEKVCHVGRYVHAMPCMVERYQRSVSDVTFVVPSDAFMPQLLKFFSAKGIFKKMLSEKLFSLFIISLQRRKNGTTSKACCFGEECVKVFEQKLVRKS